MGGLNNLNVKCRSDVLRRSRDREREADMEDEEEAYERKKMERRLREKEAAYQEVRWICIQYTWIFIH